jgi:hypothetical protein
LAVGGPVRFGSLILWTQFHSDGTVFGGSSSLAALSSETGKPADLPSYLRGTLHYEVFYAGDADTLVVTSGERLAHDPGPTHFWTVAWPASGRDPVTVTDRVVGSRQGLFLGVAGPWVAWNEPGGRYVADLRSHSFTQIDTSPDGFQIGADALTIDSTLIRPSQLPPLPGCGTTH